MFWFLFIGSGLLGLLVGSFANVCILRYGTGASVAFGRSACPVCSATLRWYELIPVVSFLIQGGRCRSCHSRISWQYPVVEAISATLFIFVFVRQYDLYPLYAGFAHGLLYSALFALYYFTISTLLLIIAVYDLKHKIIPQGPVWTFIILSTTKLLLFFVCVKVNPLTVPYTYDLFAPLILFIPFWLLWIVSKGRWIGFGDAKLAWGIGALLGFAGGLSAIVFGFWIGAAICLLILLTERIANHFLPSAGSTLNWSSEVPLAPFLIAGVFIALFLHWSLPGIGFFNV